MNTKTFKLLTLATLALTLGLVSCMEPEVPSQKKKSKVEIENSYRILKSYPQEEIPASGQVDLKDITEIADGVFTDYTKLKEVTAKSMQKIGAKAFSHSSLIKLTLGSRIPETAENAFEETSGEKSLVVDKGKETDFYAYAYKYQFATINGKAIPQIAIENGVLTMYPDFLITERIELPEEVNAIGDMVFAGKTSIKEVHAPSATKIGKEAFKGATSLKVLELGATIPEVAEGAFDKTPMHKDLIVPAESVADYKEWATKYNFTTINGEEIYPIPDGVTIEGNVLTSVSGSIVIETLELPPYVTEIGFNAFKNRPQIRHIIGVGVVEVKEKGMSRMGKLVSAKFPNLKKIGRNAFEQCSNLKEFTAPKLEEIGAGAFKSDATLKKINFPLLKEVPVDAFNARWDGKMETIILPSATKIDDNAFGYQVNVKMVEFGATPPTLTAQAFSNDLKGKNPKVVVPAEAVAAYGGEGAKWHKEIFVVEAKK